MGGRAIRVGAQDLGGGHDMAIAFEDEEFPIAPALIEVPGLFEVEGMDGPAWRGCGTVILQEAEELGLVGFEVGSDLPGSYGFGNHEIGWRHRPGGQQVPDEISNPFHRLPNRSEIHEIGTRHSPSHCQWFRSMVDRGELVVE